MARRLRSRRAMKTRICLAALFLHTALGCAVDAAGDTDGVESDEEIAQVTESLVSNYPVGIVPLDGRCPVYTEMVTVYFDAEDHGNSFESNWVTPTSYWSDTSFGGGGVTMQFCKVAGEDFKALTSDSFDTSQAYAVLRLGSYCMPWSTAFTLDLSAEIDDNRSTVRSGNFSPNVAKFGYYSQARLNFCLVQSSSTQLMSSFPSYVDGNWQSVPYGIFHDWEAAQPAWASSRKYVFFDTDNDRDFTTTYGPSSSGFFFEPGPVFAGIIEWDATYQGKYFEYARVR
jgi:hypothetical protein